MKALAEIARKYIGTPFRHQGRIPGHGLDCAGVVVCAMREAGLDPFDWKGYNAAPRDSEILAYAAANAEQLALEEAAPGDVIVIRYCKGAPLHFVVLSGDGKLIHANQTAVMEHAITPAWRRRMLSAWRVRGLGCHR